MKRKPLEDIAGTLPVAACKFFKFDFTLVAEWPDTNGFELCSRLKEHPRLHDTPVVFVSGRSCLEDQQHGLDVGAADYITKPFETFEFAPRLLSHIRQVKETALR